MHLIYDLNPRSSVVTLGGKEELKKALTPVNVINGPVSRLSAQCNWRNDVTYSLLAAASIRKPLRHTLSSATVCGFVRLAPNMSYTHLILVWASVWLRPVGLDLITLNKEANSTEWHTAFTTAISAHIT